MSYGPWILFVLAAVLEVGGDAVIRRGLRRSGLALIIGGMLMLAVYGLIVNTVKWDFSKLMGIYVAMFALVAVVIGRWVLREEVPASTWIGVGVIVAGGLIIQFGGNATRLR